MMREGSAKWEIKTGPFFRHEPQGRESLVRSDKRSSPGQENRMVLSWPLTSYVLKRTRQRGRDYFVSGRVTVFEGDAWHVAATVRGSRSYDVKLSRVRDVIEAWCSCPYCESYRDPCKHIWASLLAAEAERYLLGDGRRPVRRLTLAPPDGVFEIEDEEWYETMRPSPSSRARTATAHSKRRSRRPRQEVPGWKETLSRLHATPEQTPAITSAALPPGHELIYIVDRPASLASNGLVLEVATRHRKRDGEWSKPKGRRFTQSEIARLSVPADRQAMAMLAGGREQVGVYHYSPDYYDSAPARIVLAQCASARPCYRCSAARAGAS